MSETFLLDHFDDHDHAILTRADGTAISIPVEWLPKEAQKGHTLQISLNQGVEHCNITLELVGGNTDPTGVNVGG